MILNRKTMNFIRYIMDEWLPPALRDSPLLMKPLMKIFVGGQADILYRYKERALIDNDIKVEVFNSIRKNSIIGNRQTDINEDCMRRLLCDVQLEGNTRVLDAGCGNGYITEKIAEKVSQTIGLDVKTGIATPDKRAQYKEGWIEEIPFPDSHFDCVVCLHCIEHVRDIAQVMRELRRVARRRLIIVTPKQRPYYATFDTHLHFFPYPHTFRLAVKAPADAIIEIIDGDIYYVENMESSPASDA